MYKWNRKTNQKWLKNDSYDWNENCFFEKKMRLRAWGYTNGEYLYMILDGGLKLKYKTYTIKSEEYEQNELHAELNRSLLLWTDKRLAIRPCSFLNNRIKLFVVVIFIVNCQESGVGCLNMLNIYCKLLRANCIKLWVCIRTIV